MSTKSKMSTRSPGVASHQSVMRRRETTSAWPGDTGKPSQIANADRLAAIHSACGMSKKGDSESTDIQSVVLGLRIAQQPSLQEHSSCRLHSRDPHRHCETYGLHRHGSNRLSTRSECACAET